MLKFNTLEHILALENFGAEQLGSNAFVTGPGMHRGEVGET